MANDVPAAFLSYCHEDVSFALRLAQNLKVAGARVWFDRLDISFGERWDDAIQKAMNECPRMLVILSPASVDSENVRDELSYALDEKKPLIPVLYQQCSIPYRVRRFQYVDFTADFDEAFQGLLGSLGVEQPVAIGVAASSNPEVKTAIMPGGLARATAAARVQEIAEAMPGAEAAVRQPALPNPFLRYANLSQGIRISYPPGWSRQEQEAPGSFIVFFLPRRMLSIRSWRT